jgi:hypothetical protein
MALAEITFGNKAEEGQTSNPVTEPLQVAGKCEKAAGLTAGWIMASRRV